MEAKGREDANMRRRNDSIGKNVECWRGNDLGCHVGILGEAGDTQDESSLNFLANGLAQRESKAG